MIQWNKLLLGRYICAVTGHNNLLYHLHNINNDISPLCHFCLEDREEFHHLATNCPTRWWERHNITAQDKSHKWTPQQIVNFTLIPKINAAFAKPLYVLHENQDHHEIGFRSQNHMYPEVDSNSQASKSDISVMDVASESDSALDYQMSSSSSNITVCSNDNINYH